MLFRFLITPTVDDEVLAAFRLWIGPDEPSGGSLANGDVWLDMSASDTSIGNANAGSLIGASQDYLVKLRNAGAWHIMGYGGQKGQRATIPLPFTAKRGTRWTCTIECEAADRRWQIEGWGWLPQPITSAQ